MKLAVNYSNPAADLLYAGALYFDVFKCPAWPELVAKVKKGHQVYVHFPLAAGAGIGDAIDAETKTRADWRSVEALLSQTGTPLVNLHLAFTASDYPEIPLDTRDPKAIEVLRERAVQDVSAVVERFGRERVIVENIPPSEDRFLRPTYLPETICRVIEETGCGLLLDLSHARLAAWALHMQPRDYVNQLPVDHIREIHVTGIQRIDRQWAALARQRGVNESIIQRFSGQVRDHLPMTDRDWDFFDWALEQIRAEHWGKPWVVAFEYGGVGEPYLAVTDADILAEQVPRLYAMVKNDSRSLSRQRYSQFAQSYVSSRSHAKGADLDRLLELAQPQADWVALDVATGGGHTALKFAPHVAQVTATDLTPRMLKAAADHIVGQGVTNVVFQLADAEDLPFESASFDLVTCRIAPHHFPDAARFVREGARVLKPGGLLLVQDHVLPADDAAGRYVDAFERLRDPSHNRAFNESEWRRMFEDAALTVEHVEQIVKEHEFVDWVERQSCTDEVVARLEEMMAHAPTTAAEWLQPREVGSAGATFVNHHIIIAGRAGVAQA